MIGAEDYPATKTVTQVDDSSAADETDNIWESCPECQDENLKIATEHMVIDEKCTLKTSIWKQHNIIHFLFENTSLEVHTYIQVCKTCLFALYVICITNRTVMLFNNYNNL